MRIILAAFLFCSTSTIANAEAQLIHKPVLCEKTSVLFKTLKDDYEEMPLMMGQDASNDSKYILFVNSKAGTWTFVQFTQEYACMIGFGTNSKLVLGEKI